MKKKLIIRIVLIVIISLIIGLAVFRISATGIGRNQLPMPFGFALSVVKSGSMEPTLSVGDLIVVTPADEYAVGDIVVFQDGRSLVVHTIISIEDDMVITQGDANNVADDPIPLRDIEGKVKTSFSGVGYVIDFIKSVPGTILILGIAVLLYVLSMKKERKEDDKDIDELRAEIERLKGELDN